MLGHTLIRQRAVRDFQTRRVNAKDAEGTVELVLLPEISRRNLIVVVFVQDPQNSKILAASELSLR